MKQILEQANHSHMILEKNPVRPVIWRLSRMNCIYGSRGDYVRIIGDLHKYIGFGFWWRLT